MDLDLSFISNHELLADEYQQLLRPTGDFYTPEYGVRNGIAYF